MYRVTLGSSFSEVDKAVALIKEHLTETANPQIQHDLLRIQFILRELLNNAVEHGNHFDIAKKIICKITLNINQITMEIEDEGLGYDLTQIEEELDLDNDILKFRKRGLMIIRKMGVNLIVDKNRVIATLPLGATNYVRGGKN